MLWWRTGFLLASLLMLAYAQDEENRIECTDGECVPIAECKNGELEDDGQHVINIRLDAEDECDDYLLKCCPYPKDEDDDPSAALLPGTATAGPSTNDDVTKDYLAELLTEANVSNFGGPSMLSGANNLKAENLRAIPQRQPTVAITEPQRCGVRNPEGVKISIKEPRDGEAQFGEFPWMAAILHEQKALDLKLTLYKCGGSLIHPSVVLTTAHCVQDSRADEFKVRLGEWDTQSLNEPYPHQERNVAEIVSHADFYAPAVFNDVALLFLDKPVDLSKTVNTICLPPANHTFNQERCFASGWGKDVFGKEGSYQVILKKAELPFMPRGQCQRALRTTALGRRFKLHSSFICAGGEEGRDTCKGDGGSPLACPIPGATSSYYQAGMVAWGIRCGMKGIPGVYVNVPMFREWIDDQLQQRSLSTEFYNYGQE